MEYNDMQQELIGEQKGSIVQYAAVCCYFGQWPEYFQFWLKSCSYNDKIDFYLVSDIPTNGYEVPENVHIVTKTFAQVQELVRTKFPEISVSLDRPYKLCDFKTAYGYIFEDLFKGYDYWGFYDIDTIWGDILKFIPDNEDSHFVKIFPCGHLSFVRNVAPYNRIYELVNNVAGTPCRNNMQGEAVATWQECFSSPDSHYYDEEGGLEPALDSLIPHPSPSIFHQVIFDNILPPWRFDHFLSINSPEKSHCLVYGFDNGKLCRHYLKGLSHKTEEIGYLHVSKRKFTVKVPASSRFSIYPDKIVNFKNWNLLSMLVHGRCRYLNNVLHRVLRKFACL